MYGKSFESMYEGSMVGAGMNVFAVWGYIITNTHRAVIEINPKLLAFRLGGAEKDVEDALEFLCQPDLKSRTKAEEGRRLIKEGQFQYKVVNWENYQRIRNEGDRREYNRVKQAEYRYRKKSARKNGKPLPGETAAVREFERTGDDRALDGDKPAIRKFNPAAVDLPQSLNTPEFKAAWTDWCKFRSEKKEPIREVSVRRMLSRLEEWGQPAAMAAMENSIVNGWTGLFPVNGKVQTPAEAMFDRTHPDWDKQRAGESEPAWVRRVCQS